MNLFVDELVTSLRQDLTTGDSPVMVYAVRPHLMRWLNPSGSLYLEIQDNSGTVIATSDTVAISSLQTVASPGANYFHGMVRFVVSAHLAANTTYRFVLQNTGYTFSDSAFVGWANAWDLGIYTSDFSPSSGLFAARHLEVWQYKLTSRGATG